jgi:signal transduction histidine kinase
VSAVLPLKERSRELLTEIALALQPYFPDITANWRETISSELQPTSRMTAALEQLTIASGSNHLCRGDFQAFFENLHYFGTRLAKLQVDTRTVARSLELFQSLCEPYMVCLFNERRAEAKAAIETLSSAAFVTVSGAYFDTQKKASAALLSILEAELRAGNLSTLLKLALEISVVTFGGNAGVVLLREPDSDLLRIRSRVGPEFGTEDISVRVGHGFSGAIAQSGEPGLVLDASRDESVENEVWYGNVKSLWGMPLRVEKNTIGVLLIGFSRPYEWLPTERELMRAIADRSALAIHRARITEALRARERQIAELSAHLLRVQEEERKRISRELHDETGQALMVIRLYLGMLENAIPGRGPRAKVRETVEVVDRTIDGIRRIIGKLSPLVLQELGLVAAIRKEAKDLAKNTGVRARVTVDQNVGRLEPEVEIAVYRIVQEALHNVAKHAHAKSVNVHVSRQFGLLRLVVEDDGIGVTAKSGNSRGHSFGLAGIKERVNSMRGEMALSSSAGSGTRLEVNVPLSEAAVVSHAVAAGSQMN